MVPRIDLVVYSVTRQIAQFHEARINEEDAVAGVDIFGPNEEGQYAVKIEDDVLEALADSGLATEYKMRGVKKEKIVTKKSP